MAETKDTQERGGRGSSGFFSFVIVCCILAAVYFLFFDKPADTSPRQSGGTARQTPATTNLTGQTFQKAAQSGVLVIDFWAEWCGPCKTQAPIIDRLAARYAGRATIAKVDVDAEQSLADRFGVQGIPTVIIFKNGKETGRFVGLTSEEELAKALQSVI